MKSSSHKRSLPESEVAASLRRRVPMLPWRPVAEREPDGRLCLRKLELRPGEETTLLEQCGCAEEEPGNADACCECCECCEYCLPRRLRFEVEVRRGGAEFIGEVHFKLAVVRSEHGAELATYEYYTS